MSEVQLTIPIIWAMPHKYTFSIRPIKDLLTKYEVGIGWFDPFAGKYSPAEIKNDLDPDSNAEYHLEAFDFVKLLEGKYRGCIFDPPYSITQVSLAYKNIGLKFNTENNLTGGFPKVRDRISYLIELNGLVISCGWNTTGMGKKRGFEKIDGLCVEHGSNRNNTLVIVERKIQDRLL